MYKLFFFFCGLLLMACNNQTSAPANATSGAMSATSTNAAKTWSSADEFEFIDGCVDNARNHLGEAEAYALCKCMLGQVKEKYAAADSIAIATHLSDTTQITQMMRKCK